MAKTKHYRATVNLLRPFFTNRPKDFKIKIADGYVEMQNSSYIYWNGREFQQLEQLNEAEGLRVFVFTEDNRFLLEEYKMEEVVPEREWVVEPLKVQTEEGETVGAVGMIYDEVNNTNMVVYLSAEGTVSTITLWEKGNTEEKNLAIQDLRALSNVLIEIINKLPND